MTIKYKNTRDVFISLQQALQLDEYIKLYFEDGVLIREEEFYKGEINIEYIHNRNGDSHEDLHEEYPESVIVDHINYLNGYRLEKAYSYEDGTLVANTHTLIDTKNKTVGNEVIFDDEDGRVDHRAKVFWDLSKNPDKEILKTTYYPNVETVNSVYLNEEHIDFTGQDSIAFGESEIDQLMEYTGMSLELATYYFSVDIIPPW